jgi:uncharacterized membrane protein YhaH (DUF805 family)
MSRPATGGRRFHPGWSGWFAWGGYRGRLSYLGASLLAALAVGAVGAVVVAHGTIAGIGAGNVWPGVAIAAVAGIVAWICILAQRMRDIGMPVIPSLVGYGLASALASAGVAVRGDPESAAPWSADYPLWLNLLQLGLAVFALALVIVPGNAWLDED